MSTADINAVIKMKNIAKGEIPDDMSQIEEKIAVALKIEFGVDMFGGEVEVKAQVIE